MPSRFTRGTAYIPFEHRESYTLAIKLGVGMMPDNFVCSICEVCKGTGYGMNGYETCFACDGYGLTQAGYCQPAFPSQRNQVLEAARSSQLLDLSWLHPSHFR